MTKMPRLALVGIAVFTANTTLAQLKSVEDNELSRLTGQAGVSIDLSVDGKIDRIMYVDTDDAGRLALADTRIYGGAGGAVAIEGVTIDVEGESGLKIGFGRVGTYNAETHEYDALNVKIGDVMVNDTTIGTVKINNLTNFITNQTVGIMNILFGTNYTLNADNEVGKYIDGGLTIKGRTMDSAAESQDGGLIIDSRSGGYIERVAWVDSGQEMGLYSVGIFDTEGNEIVAMNQHLELDLVDQGDGNTALQISGMKMEGHIAIGSIYLGNPMNSLGSLMISGIDMEETTVRVYAH